MKIFVMRHGQAEPFSTTDSARCLNEFGVKQALMQGLWLKSNAPLITKVLVSPYARAQQTYDNVNLSLENQLTTYKQSWDEITPNGNASIVCEYLTSLANQQDKQTLLIISHLPLVFNIVSKLCPEDHPICFNTATIAEIDWLDNKGKVKQVIHAAGS